jgi:hypothetical protein
MKMLRKVYHKVVLRLCLAAPAALYLIGCTTVHAQSTPNIVLEFPGGDNSFSTIPFTGSPDSVRFQEVFDFQGLPPILPGYNGPFLIRLLRFREDADKGFASFFPDFQINLSTTSRSADGLSSVFSENVGANETVVVPRGTFRIAASSDGSFSAFIGLASNPFYYDPSRGNLLLDIRNFGGGMTSWSHPPFSGPAYVDASEVLGDRVSSVFGPVDSLSGTTSTRGLVTQFWLTPLPLLAVSLQSSNLLIRWRHPLNPFMLERSARLGSGATWQAAGGIERTNGAYKEVTLPLDTNAPARFFRLVLPPSSVAQASDQTAMPLGGVSKQEH